MFLSRPLLIVSLTSAAFALTAIAPPHFGVGSQAAFAKDDKDNGGDHGNGNGNGGGNSNHADNGGNGNGNGGDNGNGKDKDKGGDDGRQATLAPVSTSPGKSASASGQNKPAVTSVAPTTSPAKPAAAVTGKSNGASAKTPGLDAQIASLHAANANLNAFIHAAPNSKVGQIAAYAKSEVVVEIATAARDGAKAAADAAAATLAGASSDYAASVGVLTTTYGYTDTSDTALQMRRDELAAIDPTTLTPEQAAELAAIDVALADSAALADAEVALADATAAAASAEQALAEAQAAATAALNAAANANRTPVDPAVKSWVDAQLQAGGVLDYYRAATPAPQPAVAQ